MMTRVLVLGAYGLLGATLCPILTRRGHEIMRQGRGSTAERCADPTELTAMHQLIDKTHPDAVINLVAMTNVDACESDPQAAYRANVRPLELLTRILRNTDCHLMHISTDQVYDGSGPHTEDQVDPCNIYALSKYTGELIAAEVGATIFRTNFVGRSRAPNRTAFTDWLVHSFREQDSITLFDDVFFSAMHMTALCDHIERAIQQRIAGTYNLGCSDSMSKARFALKLAEQLGFDTRNATIGRAVDIPLRVRRPRDMSLDVSRFEQVFGSHTPTMAQTIQQVAQDYQNDHQNV